MHTLAYASIFVVLAGPPVALQPIDSEPETLIPEMEIDSLLAGEHFTIELGQGGTNPFTRLLNMVLPLDDSFWNQENVIIYGGPFNERTLAHQKGGAIIYPRLFQKPAVSKTELLALREMLDLLRQREETTVLPDANLILPNRSTVLPSEPTLAPDDDPSDN